MLAVVAFTYVVVPSTCTLSALVTRAVRAAAASVLLYKCVPRKLVPKMSPTLSLATRVSIVFALSAILYVPLLRSAFALSAIPLKFIECTSFHRLVELPKLKIPLDASALGSIPVAVICAGVNVLPPLSFTFKFISAPLTVDSIVGSFQLTFNKNSLFGPICKPSLSSMSTCVVNTGFVRCTNSAASVPPKRNAFEELPWKL